MTDLARLHRLRDQLAVEHEKAVRADQQPRPDLDHLRVTAHNGIAAGLETALFFVGHHLREAGEEGGTTPDNPAASDDAAGNCCVCGDGRTVYRNHQEQPFCGPCANCPCGETPCVRTGINDPAVSGDAALRTALAEALAYLHALTRVGGSVIGYQTVNVIPAADYDRWCAARDAGAGQAGERP